jgi:hypothetical protein
MGEDLFNGGRFGTRFSDNFAESGGDFKESLVQGEIGRRLNHATFTEHGTSGGAFDNRIPCTSQPGVDAKIALATQGHMSGRQTGIGIPSHVDHP